METATYFAQGLPHDEPTPHQIDSIPGERRRFTEPEAPGSQHPDQRQVFGRGHRFRD